MNHNSAPAGLSTTQAEPASASLTPASASTPQPPLSAAYASTRPAPSILPTLTLAPEDDDAPADILALLATA